MGIWLVEMEGVMWDEDMEQVDWMVEHEGMEGILGEVGLGKMTGGSLGSFSSDLKCHTVLASSE